MSNALALSAPTGISHQDRFNAYLHALCRRPLLSASEEHAAAICYRESGDRQAAQTLILGNLRFVVHVARGYQGYGLPLQDLVQEGSIGLMKAVQRFDPTWNVRLVSYAVHWIKAQIHEFVLRNFRIVRQFTTKAQRKLFFRLRGLKRDSGWMNEDETLDISRQLNVSASEVRHAEMLFSTTDLPVSADGGDPAPEHWLAQEGADPLEQIEAADWNAHMLPRLNTALQSLDARARDIIYSRTLAKEQPAGLAELGHKHGISAERVRQIESRACSLLRENLNPLATA